MSQTCANPGCDHAGTRKCSACSLVAYCGPVCQKAHWSQHKKVCKSSKASSEASPKIVGPAPVDKNNLPPQVTYELVQRLQAAKMETQKAFNSGDFQASVKYGNEALQCARMLPEPGSSIESVQIHLNMSTAYLQLGKTSEAKIHSSLCVEIAERGVASRPNDNLSIEMLVVALGSRTFVLLHESGDSIDNAKADEAEGYATRALSLAEKIYPANDTKLFKPLRMLGLIKDKQGKFDKAVELLDRAYTVASQGYGAAHQEAQLSMDDIIATLVKKAAFDPDNFDKANEQAEKYARANLLAVTRSEVEKDHLVVGDAAGRLATVLARAGKEADAEPLMRQSLAVREKHLGKTHPLVGVTLGFLAGILEGQENYGDEPEELLLRAIEIFKRAGGGSDIGPEGPGRHLHSATAHLQRIRMKRQGVFPQQPVELIDVPEDDDDDDDDVEEIDVSKSTAEKVAVKPKAPAPAPSASAAAKSTDSSKTSTSKSNMPKLDADDGVGRMKHAAYFYETQQFSKAEILLAEAFEIFLKENGPKHQSTLAAKQNLEVVRNQGLMLLWQEVAREQMAKLSLNPPTPTSTTTAAADADPAVAANTATDAAVSAGAGTATTEDITWVDSVQSISPEEEWLFREPEKKSQCTIC